MTRSAWRVWAVACAAAAAALLSTLLPAARGEAAAGAVTAPWTVEVAPGGPYVDGQPLTVSIRTPPQAPAFAAEIRLCRLGVEYQGGVQLGPDYAVGGPNCTPVPPSTNGDVFKTDSRVRDNGSRPQGSITSFRVSTGVAQWNHQGVATSLECSPASPCALVVQVRGLIDGRATWVPSVHELTFRESDPIAGCGGPAEGILRSAGADRITETYIDWTVDECRQPGRSGAATQAIFSGEGLAVTAFKAGLNDFAYTGLGYHADAMAEPVEGVPARPTVLVPVGINATVLAVGGGTLQSDGSKVPYSDVSLTLDEAAALVSGGVSGISPSFPEIFERNPDLADSFFSTSPFRVGASAEADATSWFFTRHLDTLRPDSWRVPDLAGFEENAGRERGIDAGFAVADPPYDRSLNLYSGRPILRKALAELDPNANGGAWVVTDRASATALGLTSVKLENAGGIFVGPTDASVIAGLASTTAGDGGVRIPDPAAVESVGGITPYPLSFVEYILAPAQPLLEADCTPRTKSQALLAGWLSYVTGPGQAELPAGMLPLTPELAAEAEAAVALVGASAPTGACAPAPPLGPDLATPPPPGDASAPFSAGGFSAPLGDFTTNLALAGGAAAFPGAAAAGTSAATDEAAEELATLPAFAGRAEPGRTGTLVAMAGLLALSGLGALLGRSGSPGRRRSPTLDPR